MRLFLVLALCCSLHSGFSQVIKVTITVWAKYNHPMSMTLHTAMLLDSVETTYTAKGYTTYIFNLNTMEIEMTDCKDVCKKFNIVNVIPTESILNVDAEIEGRYYNFLVAENDSNFISLIIQNFKKEEGKSIGLFSNDAKVETVYN
jgi:hypothetical protein